MMALGFKVRRRLRQSHAQTRVAAGQESAWQSTVHRV